MATTILLCGDRGDTSLSGALIPALAANGGVRYSSADFLEEFGAENRFFLYDCEFLPQIRIPKGIVIFKNSVKMQRQFFLPPGFVCVLESKNTKAAEMLGGSLSAAVTCGTSPRDTISVAALENNLGSAMLSLQRSLKTLDGQILEPHDFQTVFKEQKSPSQILFISAALLISGVDTAGGLSI